MKDKKKDNKKIENKNDKTEKKKNILGISRKTHIIIIAVIIIAIIAVAAIMLFAPSTSGGAQIGDTVDVRYVGKFTNGTIFDTNIEDVAKENNMMRTSFPILTFTIGQSQVIPGFETAVIGMRIGDKKTVTIAPADAYGERDPEKITTVPRINEMNITTTGDRIFTLTTSAFSKTFDEDPVLGEQYVYSADNVTYEVVNITGDKIQVKAMVEIGQEITSSSFPWTSTVVDLDEETITLRQNAVDGQVMSNPIGNGIVSIVGDKLIITIEATVGTRFQNVLGVGVVSKVTADEIELDTNHPLAGQTLIFEIEVTNITKPVIDNESTN